MSQQRLSSIEESAHPLVRTRNAYDPLMDLIGDARFVLVGEATHGTHEFYEARAQITKRLIAEKGFTAVAVEADWPDAYRVNRYVRGVSDDATARQALAGFERFPVWMWRNSDVLSFVEWLRTYNDSRAGDDSKVGFYGLDLYLYQERLLQRPIGEHLMSAIAFAPLCLKVTRPCSMG
jgi:erythromycin esterase-like protein